MTRTSDPGPPDDDVEREAMQLWNNYEDEKVGLKIGAMETELTPKQARKKADQLEAEFGGTDVGEDDETQQFISDLRERADAVEGGEDE